MRQEPELLVPVSERTEAAPPPKTGGWRLAVYRAWCLLACVFAWFNFTAGTGPLHFRDAIFTLAGFWLAAEIASWITRPLFDKNERG